MGIRGWLLLCITQIAVPALLAMSAQRAADGDAMAVSAPLRVIGVIAIVGIFTCLPVLMVKAFISLQARIGNSAHPLAEFLQRHDAVFARTMLIAWVVGAIIAAALILRIRAP